MEADSPSGGIAGHRAHTSAIAILLTVTIGGASCADDAGQHVSFERLAETLEDCRGSADNSRACDGIIYVWSEEMPLSEDGLPVIRRVAEQQGMAINVLRASVLRGLAQEESRGAGDRTAQLARHLIALGATVHYPSAIVYRDGRLAPSALVGFKTEDGWKAAIGGIADRWDRQEAVAPRVYNFADVNPSISDIPIDGTPGAYFRVVRDRGVVVFELQQEIYFLDLKTGALERGPGRLDFIPSPDGRLFATPNSDPDGLAIYSATIIFARLAEGTGLSVKPAFVDSAMHDQYPSIGLLHIEADSIAAYRILTAWRTAAAFRDYAVVHHTSGRLDVRPITPVTPACPGTMLSLPIISPSGRELAARDEATGTTAIFGLEDDGSCIKKLDLAVPTGKVAWHDSGKLIAFSIPRGVIRDGSGVLWTRNNAAEEWAGVFIYDRSERLFSRVAGSEMAEGLIFPEFADSSAIIFLFFRHGDEAPRFRKICCVGN